MKITPIITSLFQDGPTVQVKVALSSLAIVGSALWSALTGVLTVVLVVVFLADVALGILRAMHTGGLRAFSWDRFWRAGIKFGAAMVGIILAASVDIVIQQSTETSAMPTTSGFVSFAIMGFAGSGVANLASFFPGVERVFDRLVGRAENGDGTVHPMRRSSDGPQEEGGAS